MTYPRRKFLLVGLGAGNICTLFDLVCNRQFESKDAHSQIYVVEKNAYYGGRAIDVEFESTNGVTYRANGGPGRFAGRETHPYVWSVIDRLKALEKERGVSRGRYSVEVTESKSEDGAKWAYVNTENEVIAKGGYIEMSRFAASALEMVENDPVQRRKLELITFAEFMEANAQFRGRSKELATRFGFLVDFYEQNALQALYAFGRAGFKTTNEYYGIKGGMRKLLVKMMRAIADTGFDNIAYGFDFAGYNGDGTPSLINAGASDAHSQFIASEITKSRFEHVFLNIPPSAPIPLLNFMNPTHVCYVPDGYCTTRKEVYVTDMLKKAIVPLTMMRFYGSFVPNDNGTYYWELGDGTKLSGYTTDNELGMGVVVPPGGGVFKGDPRPSGERFALVAYNDGENAEKYHRLIVNDQLTGSQSAARRVSTTLEDTFRKKVKMTGSKGIVFSRDNAYGAGTHVWAPLRGHLAEAFRSVEDLAQVIRHRLPVHKIAAWNGQGLRQIHVVGEAVATNGRQQWMDGAFETALESVRHAMAP